MHALNPHTRRRVFRTVCLTCGVSLVSSGFFDVSATVHTAEVVVPRAELLDDKDTGNHGRKLERTRCGLLLEQTGKGCDAEHNAWWVPDCNLETSPLYYAVRASLISDEELEERTDVNVSPLDSPIANEALVRSKVARLLQSHLDRFPTKLADDEAELLKSGLSTEVETALHILLFEKRLLTGAVHRLLEEQPTTQEKRPTPTTTTLPPPAPVVRQDEQELRLVPADLSLQPRRCRLAKCTYSYPLTFGTPTTSSTPVKVLPYWRLVYQPFHEGGPPRPNGADGCGARVALAAAS